MKKAYLILLAILLIVVPLGITGCNSNTTPENSDASQVTITFSELSSQKHIVKQAELGLNGVLIVTLGTNPSTGYSWGENPAISDSSVIKQSGKPTVTATTTGIVGAPENEVWTFEPMKAGTSKLSFEYGQPWSPDTKGTFTVEITVTVS